MFKLRFTLTNSDRRKILPVIGSDDFGVESRSCVKEMHDRTSHAAMGHVTSCIGLPFYHSSD